MQFVLPGVAAVALASCVGALWQLRKSAADELDAQRTWEELGGLSVALPDRYEPKMVANLPEPARRFFAFAIEPGTRLTTVAELRMQGDLSLGKKEAPNEQPLTARQILAAPHGFVWEIQAGTGLMRISGSDGMVRNRSWTRFWLLRLLPVARVDGDADHLRSSFGRVVAEAAIWTPAFFLPREGIVWSVVDSNTARVTVTHGALTQAVDIRIDESGQPIWVSMPRWTNANPGKVYQIQPFGGELADFRKVSGYRVPFRVDGGNFSGPPSTSRSTELA